MSTPSPDPTTTPNLPATFVHALASGFWQVLLHMWFIFLPLLALIGVMNWFGSKIGRPVHAGRGSGARQTRGSAMTTIEPTPAKEIVIVRRWRRFGHDRAYVEINGTDVGYRDLTSGEIVCENGEHTHTVAIATESLVAQSRAASYEPKHASPDSQSSARCGTERQQDAPRCPDAAATSPSTLLPDMDLVGNRPGQAIRVQAHALREAAPIHTALARVFNVHTDERAFRIGADAEEEVARRLAKLGPEWRVLHSIPVGDRGSDIDHLVMGPAGVFTINTKNHPSARIWVRGDTFKVNGHNHYYVRNSRHEAGRAAKFLTARALFDVDVTGVIAVMGASGGFTVKEQPSDGKVVIVRRKDIARYLSQLPVQLGAPSIERIYSVARHLSTWQPAIVGWSDF